MSSKDRRRALPASTVEVPRVLPEQDLPSVAARKAVESWSQEDVARFAQCLRRASSDLQRELLHRALVAGHPSGALEDFAAALRGMSDEEAFEACTADPAKWKRSTVSMDELLAAQADPLNAFRLNGFEGQTAPEETAPPKARRTRERSGLARRAPADLRFEPTGERTHTRSVVSPTYGEDLLCEAVAPLGLTYREQVVDGPRLSLERALDAAALALGRGMPVPIILGPEAADHRRFGLLLQVQISGKNRAFQLHDPFAKETVWVNEKEFLDRAELPLSNKMLRRITAVALPRASASGSMAPQ